MRTRVLILGSTGMLGSMILNVFRQSDQVDIYTTSRQIGKSDYIFNLEIGKLDEIAREISPHYIINCIGQIPQKKDRGFSVYKTMLKTNSQFPRILSKFSNERNIKLIQPSTNGVYSGVNGPFQENSRKRPKSFYGFTKLLGERMTTTQLNLRCSIVGPELRTPGKSLYSWLLSQPENSEIQGFTNHSWNGITTKVFANICLSLIENGNFFTGNIHIVPRDSISKYELLNLIKDKGDRADIQINPVAHTTPVDLRLATRMPERLEQIWQGIGYSSSPTIREMLFDL